ncbi:hypothetical protein F2Q69_00023109 [Brassica cretica]|uniref:Uncharacterized protein n=1 Tax=Brassica cretica TaxID=69181 RepID=A0A8S9Q825_BRACR|nr:hypothetical protein F2Q69_00023109 [Brassica cretica]
MFLAMRKTRADLVSLVHASSTKRNKETQLIFSPDPASLEHSIRKEARSLSTDNNTSVSLDSAQPLSTQTPVSSTDSRSPLSTDNANVPSSDIFHLTSIDIPSRTSIDTEPNSYGNRSNFNQNSQYQRSYNNNYNNSGNFGSSYYQKPPPPIQEIKIEKMLDKVLEAQQRMKVDFNAKIDYVYPNLNTKFETLSTHVKKIEMQVVQTGDAIRSQEASTRGVGDDVMKHHVNAII